jgi:phospholipase C
MARRRPFLVVLLAGLAGAIVAVTGPAPTTAAARAPRAATPVKHLVVIFQENVSFDHYFGTYPRAKNPPGEPRFLAAPGTPTVNGLSGGLLTDNPNAADPFRLDRPQALQCRNQHAYMRQQSAMHGGLMDMFVQFLAPTDPGCDPHQVMGYFDGNTVTALWNYAQHYALADNFFATTVGPSAPGHINLVSGQTHGAVPFEIPGEVADGTMIADADPAHDDCSLAAGDEGTGHAIALTGRNVGDLLNARGVTWGWFQGGFRPTARTGGKAVCGAQHRNRASTLLPDYIPHHEPFQYYASTANPHHLPPTSVTAIGRTDRANHQYGLTDFWRAARAGNLPAVSFLKARHFQDAHDGKSDPLSEQRFVVTTINRLQRLDAWRQMAIVIAYDDPGGWYDHVMPPIVNQSNDARYDTLLGPAGLCGRPGPGAYLGRCGHGLRLPLLVVSPFVRPNSVDHTVLDQTSILRFIETNWRLGTIGNQSFDFRAGPLERVFAFGGARRAPRVTLDPSTGAGRGGA